MKNSPFSVVAGGQHDTEQNRNNQQPHSKFIRTYVNCKSILYCCVDTSNIFTTSLLTEEKKTTRFIANIRH